MPLLDLDKITAGLSKTWSGFLRDWGRLLRAGGRPPCSAVGLDPAALDRLRENCLTRGLRRRDNAGYMRRTVSDFDAEPQRQ